MSAEGALQELFACLMSVFVLSLTSTHTAQGVHICKRAQSVVHCINANSQVLTNNDMLYLSPCCSLLEVFAGKV